MTTIGLCTHFSETDEWAFEYALKLAKNKPGSSIFAIGCILRISYVVTRSRMYSWEMKRSIR